MLKNKLVLIFAIISIFASYSYSQSVLSATFTRNSSDVKIDDYAVCPQTDVAYKITNWKASCHEMKVVNGIPEGDVTSSVSADGKITINWKDNGDSCKIIVTRKNESACTEGNAPAAQGKSFFIPVLSLAKVIPTITQTPAGKILAGFTHSITYTASAQYPFLGIKDSLDLSPFKLTSFVWTKPTLWSYTSSTTQETITVTTDLGTGGNITAYAFNRVCPGKAPSLAGKLAAERIMPTPCPITPVIQDYELCGKPIQNTFNCAPLPTNFVSPTGGVTWEWSVAPAAGWTQLNALSNTVEFQTDGKKGRYVTVKVKGYGVENTCTKYIPLTLINPKTKTDGRDLMCGPETYKLTIDPPAGVTTTWKVISLTGNAIPVTPTSGTGHVANLNLTSGGANCCIIYTLVGCDSTRIIRDTFFAGKPFIYGRKIDTDTMPGSQAFVCPGTHTVSAKVIGAYSNCFTWTITGNNPSYSSCLNADVYMSGINGTTSLQASAKNDCGANDTWFFLIPKPWGCKKEEWRYTIYPNPAYDVLNMEVKLNEGSTLQEVPKIKWLQILDSVGSICYKTEEENEIQFVNTANFKPGTYTLLAEIDGITVSEVVQIKMQ
jgi:hypothetical protein